MVQIYRQIQKVADHDYAVLITGETGTGKELVAAAIHSESRRSRGPFVPVNCGALPEGVVESELFGHVKGAFSGAVRDKKGRFELAHGGTIFLDEVAELPKTMQVKLLRVLENGTFKRVGGEKTVTVDVRVISATNRDLKREVEKGNFRQDLFYRLNVVPLKLPPLRERRDDIPLLVEHFLSLAARPRPADRPFRPGGPGPDAPIRLAGQRPGTAKCGALRPGPGAAESCRPGGPAAGSAPGLPQARPRAQARGPGGAGGPGAMRRQ